MALRPLPLKDPGSIVLLWRSSPTSEADNFSYSAFDFYHDAPATGCFQVCGPLPAVICGSIPVSPVAVRFVTPGFYPAMGQTPELGRFLGTDEAPGNIVVSHRFWQRQLGGDANVVGRQIRMNQYTAVIVGVAASKFASVDPTDSDAWIPVADHPLYIKGSRILTDSGMSPMRVFGRLLPGLSPAAAEAGLKPIIDEYRKEAPKPMSGRMNIRL